MIVIENLLVLVVVDRHIDLDRIFIITRGEFLLFLETNLFIKS